MEPSRKRLMTTIVMMALAIFGLTIVQAQLLRHAWQLKEQAFDRNVTAALSLTAQHLETGEVFDEAVTILRREIQTDSTHTGMAFHHIEVDTLDVDYHLDQVQNRQVWLTTDRNRMIMRVVDDLMLPSGRPITERTSPASIDSVLQTNLKQAGIGMEHRFVVVSSPGDSVVLLDPSDSFSPWPEKSYRAQLFQLDFLPPSFDLVVWFPGRTGFLFNQLWPFAFASLVFMIIVVVSFWVNLRTIAQQRLASASMVDFVNNMTHEFKTPISTVTLASEAIAGMEFQDPPESLLRYNQMIREETRRMSGHVEQILQFAHLEAGDLPLKLRDLSLHEVIRKVCSSFQLVVDRRKGRLDLEFEAENDTVHGDPETLTNVISNLVDNAIKYSPGPPRVIVKTFRRPGGMVFQVSDEGLGISKADQGRVFDRYFRCSTGDRHDVKGFGLGLSYVRLLVDAHRGTVDLTSQPYNGTTIRVFLPDRTQEPSHG
jgi:two-component system, OmpR family, phosphate regulon sensor histidine kinase PhoR